MGQQLHIEIYIGSKRYVKQAEQIVADMIKLYYLEGISTLDSKYEVYRSFLQKRKMLREYPESKLLEQYPNCSIKRISTYGNSISIRYCSDLQSYLSPVGSDYSGFFYSVCFAIMRELPTTPMSAESRFLMTVTDHIENTYARNTGEELVFSQESYFKYGDGGYRKDTASWRILPRCIAVNGKTL